MNTLAAALHWHALGIAPIPCRLADKRPLLPWAEFQTRLPAVDEIKSWFSHRFRNLALLTGWQGLTVLDFDNVGIYDLWHTWAQEQGGAAGRVADMAYRVKTARGVHVYVTLESPPLSTMKLGLIDVKAAGGYVLAPPSVHPSGVTYTAPDPAAPILRAGSLNELLPAELLAQAEQLNPPPLSGLIVTNALVDDPWQAAMQPQIHVDGSLVTAIRASHNILDLFPGARRKGAYYWATCPLHHDTNPSLSIDPTTGRARCWAGCTKGKAWDFIDFYAALNGLTNTQAITALAGGRS